MKTYLEQLEQLEQLERLPENHFCFEPVTGLPEVPTSTRKPRHRVICYQPCCKCREARWRLLGRIPRR